MDIGRAFTYVFHDEEWPKKVVIGGLISWIPVLALVADGYGIRALRNAREGRETPLPKWDDWGHDFVRGLSVFVAALVLGLPMVVSVFLGVVASAVLEEPACMWVVWCPGMLWALLVAFFGPALRLQYAKHDSFGALFRLREVWHIVADRFGRYLVAVLMTVVATIVAGITGGVASFIVRVVARITSEVGASIVSAITASLPSFIAMLVSAHLLAQLQPAGATAEPAAVL